MGKDKKWMEETRAAWASLMQQRTLQENMMAAVKAGKIRKHLMGNNSPIRYGTMEKREMTEYTDFVRTKLCYEILNLPGEEK